MARIELVTPATSRLLTVEQAKLHCRIQHNAEDELFTGWIRAAEDFVQDYTNRALLTSTWQWIGESFPDDEDFIDLLITPVQSITEVTYTDTDGVEQTLDPEDYQLEALPLAPRLWPSPDATWPYTQSYKADAVVVELVAGYTAANLVPARISQAMYLLIGEWYLNRDVTQIPEAVYALLDRLKAERYV